MRVSTVILAGGLGTRLGRVEKALQIYRGKTLLQHVLDAIQQQSQPSAAVYLNVNRQLADYSAYAYPLLSDVDANIQGPLAGVLTALTSIQADYLWCVPCDCVSLAPDVLANMLSLAMQMQAGVVRANYATQSIPTLALYHVATCIAQATTLPSNQALYRWQNQVKVVEYSLNADLPNFNTHQDFLG